MMTNALSTAPCLSVVVIARKEAGARPRLRAGLTGFRKRRGGVPPLDTGSTGDTVAITRAHGSRFTAEEGSPLVLADGRPIFHFGVARRHTGELAREDPLRTRLRVSRFYVRRLDECQGRGHETLYPRPTQAAK